MATARLKPNGDLTRRLNSTGTPYYEQINEYPYYENTSDYLYWSADYYEEDNFRMESQSSVDSVSEIEINVYVRDEGGWNEEISCRYYDGSWSSYKSFEPSTSYQWHAFTWTGLSLSQSQLDSLRVGIRLYGDGYWIRCAAMYVKITYTEVTGWDGGKVNGVDHSNIGKVNSVDISNINKINSV